jgi:predicted PurR-regulated permease PerM
VGVLLILLLVGLVISAFAEVIWQGLQNLIKWYADLFKDLHHLT